VSPRSHNRQPSGDGVGVSTPPETGSTQTLKFAAQCLGQLGNCGALDHPRAGRESIPRFKLDLRVGHHMSGANPVVNPGAIDGLLGTETEQLL
jgi:hypothetical protein